MLCWKEVIKEDINTDYETYGQEGDVDYVTNQNPYYEHDYDDTETTTGHAMESRSMERVQKTRDTRKRIRLILCILALLLVLVGTGVTTTIVLLSPTLQKQNGSTSTVEPHATDCVVNGGWGSWSNYGACSKACGGGTKTRTRSCTSPSPSCGGTSCAGGSSESTSCNTQCCVVNGGWSSWSNYGACSKTCGGGTKTRTRSCTNPSPSCGGTSCAGSSSEASSCNTHCCVVNGGWSSWSNYGACSKVCGAGTKTRTRSCTSPSPSCGGTSCAGSSSEATSCNTQCCAVNGGWSSWSNYGACSKSCGGGTKTRRRSCTSPVPSCGGTPCTGTSSQAASCNIQCCVVHGGWSSWSEWGPCLSHLAFLTEERFIDPCGSQRGNRWRTRSCSSPSPSCSGAQCSGGSVDTETCWTSGFLRPDRECLNPV